MISIFVRVSGLEVRVVWELFILFCTGGRRDRRHRAGGCCGGQPVRIRRMVRVASQSPAAVVLSEKGKVILESQVLSEST